MTLEISEKTMKLLQEEAQRRNTDPNTLASELILQGLQQYLESEPGFEVFSGLWSAEDADEFNAATQAFSKIDEEQWREKHPA
jgi:hypothetical protein